MKNFVSPVLIIFGSIILYFALQVASVFLSYFIFGSGSTFTRYAEITGVVFLLLQLTILSYLFYRKTIIKRNIIFAIAVLVPIALYIYLNYFFASDPGY